MMERIDSYNRSDNRSENRFENRSDNRSENRFENRSDNRSDNRFENRSDNRSENRFENRSDNRSDNRSSADREALFRQLTVQSFCLDDIKLFLDTHPDHAQALTYYNRYRALRAATFNEYTRKYGPISAYDVNATNRWTWVDTPWPWERRV